MTTLFVDRVVRYDVQGVALVVRKGFSKVERGQEVENRKKPNFLLLHHSILLFSFLLILPLILKNDSSNPFHFFSNDRNSSPSRSFPRACQSPQISTNLLINNLSQDSFRSIKMSSFNHSRW